MSSNIEQLKQRFAELAEQAKPLAERDPGNGFPEVPAEPFFAWATSAMSVIQRALGAGSPHFTAFDREIRAIPNNTVRREKLDTVRGIFLGAKDDVDGGHLFAIARSLTGEIVGDFVVLAKTALSEGHHTVAAVLASAALEDALRRLASAHGVDVDGKTMEDLVNALKALGLVSGPQKALLAAMPKLRNQAMHANWEALTPEGAGSMIGFVEQFLLVHFQ